MKNIVDSFKKADWRTKRIFQVFLRCSIIFLAFGLVYHTHLLKTNQYFTYYNSIYLFIESAFYLLAIGIASATIFEWLIRKNK